MVRPTRTIPYVRHFRRLKLRLRLPGFETNPQYLQRTWDPVSASGRGYAGPHNIPACQSRSTGLWTPFGPAYYNWTHTTSFRSIPASSHQPPCGASVARPGRPDMALREASELEQRARRPYGACFARVRAGPAHAKVWASRAGVGEVWSHCDSDHRFSMPVTPTNERLVPTSVRHVAAGVGEVELCG